ncbi:MAG TPA: ABC transporter ATP-binding protein [Candidatus Dormibacteraeota bacterium]|jgi:zinc transport system ATP-binding protein|nr:ABC transporter ATP-binding protein [Candidatus Dormibacteraeota bacterium]
MSDAVNVETDSIVELSDVAVQYHNGVTALEKITFEIFEKDLIGLMGPNGAGKSTLLSVILGLVRPTRGTVKLFGAPISPASLTHVGYVPQKAQATDVNFPSTVFETVLMGRIPQVGMFHRFNRRDREKVDRVLQMFEIQDLKDRKIGQLSGGQSQRVFVAKAVVGDPKLLLLDEPTSGVDTHSKAEFYSMLEKLNREMGITIILSSHDVATVTRLANRVACINTSLFFCGSTSEFASSPVISTVYGYPVELMHHTDHP